MKKGDINWALIAIGLDADEARLYRVLVAFGPSTVGALAPAADLSRTKVYSVLDAMVAKGYTERVTDHPRTYMAVDPERMVRRRMEDLGSAKEVIEAELTPLFKEQEASSRQMSLRGNSVYRRAEEMLGRAKRDIVFMASFMPLELGERFARLLEEVHKRGIHVRTVVSDALTETTLPERLRKLTEVRVRTVPNAGMLIIDDEEVLIGSLSPAAGPLEEGETASREYSWLQGLWSRDKELIKLQRMLFEDIYKKDVT